MSMEGHTHLSKSRQWESMPGRREHATKGIVGYIINKGKMVKDNPDNIYSTLYWLVLGKQAGFRRKEWTQVRTHLKKYKDYQHNIDGSSTTFILSTFECRGKKQKNQ